MKIKLRHDDKICCPYLKGSTCYHYPRCIRVRGCECKHFKKENEVFMKAQIHIIVR